MNMPLKQLEPLDYAVLILYLAGMVGIGVYFTRRQKTTRDYFLANRRIPGWAMGLAIISTLISNITFLANPAAALEGDWRQFTNSFMAIPVVIIIAVWVIPYYRDTIGMSLYEYFERRFGYAIRAYGAAAFILYYLARMAFLFYVLSLAIHTMTGWPMDWIILGIGFLTILYTFFGGIEAVIWTDAVQAILFVGAGVTCLAIALFGASGGAGPALEAAWQSKKFFLGESGWSLRRDTILVMLLYGLCQHGHNFGTDQTIVQRYLTAKTTRQAVRNALLGGLACVPVWGLFFFIGTAMWSYYQGSPAELPPLVAEKADRVFPYFIMTKLPAGITGLVLAGLLAAAMSTLSGGLNSVAAVFTNDLYKRANPNSSESIRLLVGRGIVILSGAISLGIALWLSGRKGQTLVLYYTALSIFAGGILGLFLLAAMSRRANFYGATAGILGCMLFALWASLTQQKVLNLGRWNYTLHPYMIGVLGHFIVIITGYAVSLLTGKSKKIKP